MTKPPLTHPDPLVMNVRRAMREMEPRERPTETQLSTYGHECWVCPYCGELLYKKGGKDKLGNYNMHFSAMHGTPFWREMHVIEVIKRATNT